jgi:hypothetical protein
MHRARLLLLPVIVLVCAGAFAQAAPIRQQQPPTEIRIGESVVPLAGPWRFAPGDSPVANDGALKWANPAFDDSAWAAMDLHPKAGEIDPGYGSPGYLTGWAARGYPKLAGFAWYRLRIHLADANKPLAIKTPDHVDDAFQVFANGKLIGSFGEFNAKGVVCYRSRPLVYPLPAPDANGDILLAIRFYMQPLVAAIGTTPDSGGMHETPLVGLPAEMEYLRVQEVQGRMVGVIADVYVSLLMLVTAAGAFWIWLLDRPRTTYLWLTLALLFEAASTVVLVTGFFTFGFSQSTAGMLMKVMLRLALVSWVVFWRRWFQLEGGRWIDGMLTALVVVGVAVAAYTYLFSDGSSLQTVLAALQFDAACKGILGLVLFATLLQGGRKDRTGALLALPPIVLLSIDVFFIELEDWLRIRTQFFPFRIGISVGNIALALMVLVIGALVARRFLGSRVAERLERQTIDQELEQASELQQRVLVPEPIVSQLFTVETAYHPARTVGGDFFQVIPHRDGSLLVVVGDVSGKGMAAAMLVAVLVGALRTRADETFDPAAILQTLNDRLIGRAGGHFATCVAAHLGTDGTMRVANAGHIPPYRNGVAMEIPGSLPLGIIAEAEYDVETVRPDAADHLTFVTDGVLEARNEAGQLLGFERLAALAALPPEAIVRAAIAHGQDDDITVVGVSLLGRAAEPTEDALLTGAPA